MSDASSIHSAITSNCLIVSQGITLLANLDASRYGTKHSILYNSSIGGHMRHIIDHYQSFLGGLDEGIIDYEKRLRDPLVESDPAAAGARLESISRQLQELAHTLPNRTLRYSAEAEPGVTTGTSVLRELESVLSHTVHHYALIAVLVRLQGFEPEPGFGVAPSTLKYQQAQALCAR